MIDKKNQKEIIIYSTTVYDYTAKINEDNLTEEGYFDLSKLKNLRIINNGFLQTLRRKHNKTRVEMAELLKVPLRTWVGWEANNKSFPFDKILFLAEKLKINRNMVFTLVKDAKFTYGLHHGKNRLNLPLSPKDFFLANYLTPLGSDRTYLVKQAPIDIKKDIINNYSFDKTAYRKNELITIYSELLHNFLKTFYFYEKKVRLRFPLTEDIHSLIKKGADLKKAVIIPLALSDGGEKPQNRLFFSGESKHIHNMWTDAFYYSYGFLPSSYLLPYKSIFVTTHNVPENILSNLKKICPMFKTSPVFQNREDYDKLKQPTIKFLYNSSRLEQETALRLWASVEGSIGIHFDKRNNLIYPKLKIACAHPNLITDLKALGKLNRINFQVIKEDKNWSGLSGLTTTSISSIVQFLKFGGFFNVKIAKSRSKYFGGFEKQDVLLGIFEFILRQRAIKGIRAHDKLSAYIEIRDIVKNKEFKDIGYYLNVFKTGKVR